MGPGVPKKIYNGSKCWFLKILKNGNFFKAFLKPNLAILKPINLAICNLKSIKLGPDQGIRDYLKNNLNFVIPDTGGRL